MGGRSQEEGFRGHAGLTRVCLEPDEPVSRVVKPEYKYENGYGRSEWCSVN